MFDKFKRSWSLVKASASVLKADKELMIFPVFSSIAFVLAGAVFFVPLLVFSPSGSSGGTWEIMGYTALFLYYFVTTFVMVFFNSALVGAALIRLDGGDPTVADGLRIARERIGLIAQWSLLAATVGMLLRAAKDRAGFIGDMVISMIGIGWNLATFLIVPVLVTRNLGPIDALKESANLLKKTWGEQIVGNAGIGFVFMIIGLVYTGLAIPLLIFSFASASAYVIVPTVITVVTGYILIALFSSTLSGIYSAALYRYAVKGDAGFMDQRLLATAFRNK